MANKKALCVGVNEYAQQGMELRGCVNDANEWAALLNGHYDFAKADITMLIDREATYASMVAGLKSLLAGATSGDVLVFTNSSHGTYLADTDGDEPTYDEAICPYDVQDHPLVDDELRTLFAELPNGVRLTVVSDSCHSGSVTRALPDTPDERRARFMDPRAIGRAVLESDALRAARAAKDAAHPMSEMREVLLAGCKSNQFSFDATIEGTARGAFSFYAQRAIRDAGYRITYRDLHASALAALSESQYDQEPQVEGTDENIDRQIFT